MAEHAVVIAGGGPTGMMLAAELALARVDVAVVEQRPDHVLVGSRAGGFHSRTIEVLDQRGVADRFLAEGQVAQAAMIGTTVLDMSDFPTRHPYSIGIWQNQIEQIMAAWIAELPVRIYYGCEVKGFAQDITVSEEVFGGFAVLPGTLAFLARIDGKVVGGCGGRIIAEARIAALFGTATLPEFRRRGVQSALIAQRLHEAALAGCEYAVVSTNPGSGSQRNMERRGFRLAYTKTVMMREWPDAPAAKETDSHGH